MLTAGLDLLLAPSCPGCRAPWAGAPPCPPCAATLRRPPAAAPAVDLPVPLAAACAHGGPAGRLVVAHKERPLPGLARPLGDALASAVRAALGDDLPPDVLLVAVPTDPAASRRRGGDHADRLARRAAASLDVRAGVPLRRRRGAGDLGGLPAHRRDRALRGAVRVRPGAALAGRAVVVVDDVVTTGASLRSAVRVLRGAGADVRAAAAVTTAAPVAAVDGR